MSTVLIRHETVNGRIKRCSKARCVVEKVTAVYPTDNRVRTASGDVWVVEKAHSSKFDYVTVG